ncbi:sodium-independent anion transporter [Paraphotobacterium marinum]|uniref:Sodium-independent anion transporter n=1 Tax=Paraphotobacterium marinum TaxID=1755811 RepID=A0A220VB81_9GAMM|nr:SulP family inorganic anion transporter [Paraphotobacterium marinum]ASK77674.1 sodium-independent anion transporter [Paraphotobacterium marinum]
MTNQIFKASKSQIKTDILSGLTVAMALIPEAVAFAFVAGVSPTIGLYGAFFMGIMSSIFGGRPGMISGATGAIAVVIVSLVHNHGIEYLFAALLLAGIFQMLFGIFKLGKFIRLVPYPVVIGFVNGLAIVIFLAQINQFREMSPSGKMHWMDTHNLLIMLSLVMLTIAIIQLVPKITKKIPPALVAIVTVTLIVYFSNIPTKTVLDYLINMSGNPNISLQSNLPSFHIPNVNVNFDTLIIILPYSLIIASVGLIESLLTLSLIDDLTETRGQSNKECKGQGLGNIACSFFGGMGGCAMIGQSMINIKSGGRTRLSGIVAAIVFLIFILFGSKIIETIPIAALVGVMFVVVYNTFEWSSFQLVKKVPKSDFFLILAVTFLTVIFDLAIAVISGIIIASLQFCWKQSKNIYASSSLSDDQAKKTYKIHGPLFFGSTHAFKDIFSFNQDPNTILIDFSHSRVCDQSGVEALVFISKKYNDRSKKLKLKHLSSECRLLLKKFDVECEADLLEDPTYKIASDVLD